MWTQKYIIQKVLSGYTNLVHSKVLSKEWIPLRSHVPFPIFLYSVTVILRNIYQKKKKKKVFHEKF